MIAAEGVVRRLATTCCPVVTCGFGGGAAAVKEAGPRDGSVFEVQTEHQVDIVVDGAFYADVACTPEYLVELVLGRLCTDGIVGGMGEVEGIVLDESTSTTAHVALRLSARDRRGARPPAVRPMAWEPDQVFALARRFACDTPMHRKTHGTHSCMLADRDDVLFCCEDIGRRNAFDKVVGYALRNGIDLGETIAFTSGRVPSDMVAKAAYAGIPVLVSAAVPTDRAVADAKTCGIALIATAKAEAFRVFSDPLGCAASQGCAFGVAGRCADRQSA